MLHEFLIAHRLELIDRCRAKVARRFAPAATDAQIEHGIPHFIDQLIRTLQLEQMSEPMQSHKVSSSSDGRQPDFSEIGVMAKQHGRELLQHGYTVDQVVHDYGDLCQAISDVAFDRSAPIQFDEFRTLHRCLDNAIAEAVTEFSYLSDGLKAEKGVQALNERLGFLAHEMRNFLHTATLAFAAIKTGHIELTGPTGEALERSLIGLRVLIDRSLADVRLTAGMPVQHGLFSLAGFIATVRVSASLEAHARKCRFVVSDVDPALAVSGDKDLLLSAVGNLLQNAFKFTKLDTEVSLNAYAAADRILIEVADRCGGLLPGDAEQMFVPFRQVGADKSGLGLGLSICRRGVEANNGALSVRDVPGTGCVFTISLPRHSLPDRSAVPDELMTAIDQDEILRL